MSELSATPVPTDNTQPAAHWWVVCLCAGWCGTCREYRALFDGLAAAAAPQERWLWVDIEDDEDLTGDLDVETFPTLLIGEGSAVRFLGPLLPQAAVLERLLESLRASPGRAAGDAQAQALLARIQQARS